MIQLRKSMGSMDVVGSLSGSGGYHAVGGEKEGKEKTMTTTTTTSRTVSVTLNIKKDKIWLRNDEMADFDAYHLF